MKYVGLERLNFLRQFPELLSSLDDLSLGNGWTSLHVFNYIPEVLLHLKDVVSALIDLLALKVHHTFEVVKFNLGDPSLNETTRNAVLVTNS